MNYLNYKHWKGTEIKNALPKDENFQIWKHKSPQSIAPRLSFEMLNNF